MTLVASRVFRRLGYTMNGLRHRHYSKDTRDVARAVTVCSNQTEIDRVAKGKSTRFRAESILFDGQAHVDREKYLLTTAQYLHKELPVRIAHRIKSFHSLPFIIGCNPMILRVHESYVHSFKKLHDFPKIEKMDQVKKYAALLERLVGEHSEDVNDMAIGFRQSHNHLSEEMIESRMACKFLDRMLSARLAMRLLAMHHVLLHKEQENHIGIINRAFYPAKAIQRWTKFVTQMCMHEYGKAPKVQICGHTQAHFPYIPMPLDYILCELLKNAMRFSVQHHPSSLGGTVPEMVVTIIKNPEDFIIRVSDRGGGIPNDLVDKVVEYNFTTAGDDPKEGLGQMSGFGFMRNPGPEGNSKMHGHGFGLPMSKCYAEKMGGSLMFQSMQGYGTDVYLRLERLETGRFRF